VHLRGGIEDQGMITCFKKYIGFIKSRTNGGKRKKEREHEAIPRILRPCLPDFEKVCRVKWRAETAAPSVAPKANSAHLQVKVVFVSLKKGKSKFEISYKL
jgi:hypothetical protein